MKEIINCAAYQNGRRIADVELNKIHEVLKDVNQFVWVGLHEPSEEILQRVQEEFNLHDLAIEDAHMAHQRPKIELYADTVFVVLRTAQKNDQNHIEFGETHFFVGKNFIISVRHGSRLAYTEVRSRCEAMPELLEKGQGFVLYAVMDFIVDRYFPVVNDMENELEAIEDINEMVDNTRELLNTALEANFSLISISQNDTSKKFAGWAAIFAVPTMVAGFWGMNFRFMPEAEWEYGFYFVIAGTIAACGLLYYLFKRSDWL